LGKAVVNNLANAGVTSAITGTSLEDNIKTGLVSAFISAGSGQAANEIGTLTQDSQALKALAHALAGCMAGGASGGKQGCESGAIGAVVGELAAQWYDPNGTKPTQDTLDFVKVVSAAAGAITGDGSAASVSTAMMTGVNAAQNNWLSHAQAKRMSELRDLALQGKCDSACATEMKQLQALDESRNRQLAACQGATTPACQSATQEVRSAAAEYIRVNAFDKGMTFTYANEKQETLTLAQQTLNGYTVWNVVKGAAGSVADGISAMATAGYTGFKALFGDEQAQAQGKQMLGAAWDFVKDPGNWPELMGALSPAQREQLAQAYAKGDGKTVATIMGEQFANLPSGGGMGTIKKVTGAAGKLDDAASLLKRADVDKVVDVPAGSKGNWDPSINTGTTGNLAPKTAYMLDNGHTYITDDAGRVKAVEGSLSLDKMDRNGYQQVCAGQSGCVGDDGGHLIASSLGGAGDRVNMVPQASTLNRQDWKAMENFFRSELAAGKTVNVRIDVGYPVSGGARPDAFIVNAMIDGKPWSKEFTQ
jgi:filamentous hemagglutinin